MMVKEAQPPTRGIANKGFSGMRSFVTHLKVCIVIYRLELFSVFFLE